MAAALQTNIRPVKFPATFRALTKQSPAPFRVRCCAVNSAGKKRYNITLLPGDGIGPEVISIAKNVLQQAGSLEGVEFSFREMPVGGAALDLVGVPLPEETVSAAKDSDAVLLGAIGGYKWDKNEKHLKPETGLLQLRAALKVFANLRPATVLPQDHLLPNHISMAFSCLLPTVFLKEEILFRISLSKREMRRAEDCGASPTRREFLSRQIA